MDEQAKFTNGSSSYPDYDTISIGQSPLSTHRVSNDCQLAVYKRRWYILFMFCAVACMNGIVWNTWGPIAVSAEPALGWSNEQIAIISIFACISGTLATPVCSWLIEVKGIRWSVLITAFTLALGTGIRVFTLNKPVFTILAYLCAIIDGFGATVVMSGGPCLSAVWFPPNERVMATALATIATFLGYSAGFLLGPLIMNDIWPPGYFGPIRITGAATFIYENGTFVNFSSILTSLYELRRNLQTLIWLEAGVSLGLFLIVLAYYPAKPPKPPSVSAASERTPFFAGILQASRHGIMWLLAIPFATAAGLYFCWTSLLDVNLKPNGVSQYSALCSQEEAGFLGFYGTLVGCATGTLASIFMDMVIRKEKWVLLSLFGICTVCSLWFAVICIGWIPFKSAELYISSIVIGATLCGSVPLFFELGCETIYPIPESVISGLMTVWNNVSVVIFFIIFYIPNIGTMWMNWCMLACCAVSIPMLVIFPEKYHRLSIDQQQQNIVNETELPTTNGALSYGQK